MHLLQVPFKVEQRMKILSCDSLLIFKVSFAMLEILCDCINTDLARKVLGDTDSDKHK